MARRRGSGEGSIFKSGNRWTGVLELPPGPDGQRRRRKCTGRTRADVVDRIRKIRAEIEAGIQSSATLTVTQLLDDYLDRGMPGTTKSGWTINGQKWSVSKLKPAIGSRTLSKLSVDDVDGLLRSMAADGYARASIVQVRGTLARAIRWAQRRDLIGRNVAELSVVPDAPRREGVALTEPQCEALFDAAKGHRLYAMFLVGLTTPCRPGELCGATWSDIDLDTGEWRVQRALHREPGAGHELRLGPQKTKQSLRCVKLAGFVVDALRAHRRAQAAERLQVGAAWQAFGAEHGGLVFANEVGGALDPSNVRRLIQHVLDAARKAHPKLGLPETLRTYDMRHVAESFLAADPEVPMVDMAGSAGHSVATANAHYVHATKPVITSAAASMERRFGGRFRDE